MLRFFIRRGGKQTKISYVQLNNFYSSKSSNSREAEIPSLSVEQEHPGKRILNCLKRDTALLKRSVQFWKNYNNPSNDQSEQVIYWDDPNSPVFPNYCDVVILGGGAMGSAVAYWCKKVAGDSLRVVVIERDPSYQKASTVLSVGGLRQQFSLEENIEMSLFGAEFIRNANDYLGIEGEPPVDLQFHPYGYLSLATADTAEVLKCNSELQNSLGAKNIILSSNQLKSKFPWINAEDIELACLGLENEGWFDPWSLLYALKRKAISMGVQYIKAEVKGFNFKKKPDTIFIGEQLGEHEELEYLIVQTEDGKLRPITFSKCVVAGGAFSADITKMARIGYGPNILSVPLPVVPRKRYVYVIHAPNGPGLNTPLTVDPTGTYFRREGLDNCYVCGRAPEEDEEPPVDNLNVDEDYFDQKIWPVLANRVKAFENLKVKSSWAGYYEFNTYDENGIISMHPYHDNLIIATGFSGHGIQQSPAVGRAVSELILMGGYKTINLNRLSFDRFITLEPMRERNCW